jgi:hypothetical protein
VGYWYAHTAVKISDGAVFIKEKHSVCAVTHIEVGKQACEGVRIDDSEVSKQNITEPMVVEEVNTHGKKYYRYTRKADFIGGRKCEPEYPNAADGSLLPGINRPRRAVIKL